MSDARLLLWLPFSCVLYIGLVDANNDHDKVDLQPEYYHLPTCCTVNMTAKEELVIRATTPKRRPKQRTKKLAILIITAKRRARNGRQRLEKEVT